MNITNIKAIAILALVVFLVYFPVTLLNHTYNPALNTARFPITDFARDYGCHTNCIGPFNFTIDPGADADSIWPLAQLTTNLYLHGIIPLWNPYLAGGTPLAADTTNFVFSPLMVFHFLPNSYWDVSLLVSVWLIGVFTYFLLTSWKLSSFSSVIGSLIFMFSGAITWYLPHDSILTVMFTPLILFSIEKIIQDKNFRYIILGSVAIALSILGGHLESIVLLLLLCSTYSIFRVLYPTFSRLRAKPIISGIQHSTVITTQNGKKIISIILVYFAGAALAAFFILPVLEYVLLYGHTSHDPSIGLAHSPAFTIASTFVPYILGPVQVYILPATSFAGSWNVLGGYVVASTLIFSLIGITFSNNLSLSNLHRRIAQFFFCVTVFFVLKSIGVPIVNELGSLPILNQIVFTRYDGFIWTLGLAISAAFGIEVIMRRKLTMKNLAPILIISFSVIILTSLLIIPYFTWQNFAGHYVIFQILQSLFFILIAFLLIISTRHKNQTLASIFCLFFLESSLYIPMGLPTIWQFYRSIVVIFATMSICAVNFIPIRRLSDPVGKNRIKLKIFVMIILFAIISQLIIYSESPQGLRIRNNAFEDTTITKFLKDNVGNSRIFSIDSAFIPNYPSAYEIQSIGIASAQNINSFNMFVQNFLDPYATFTVFDYVNNWRLSDSLPLQDVFLKNEKYYDFLGIQYLISNTTNPNNFMFGPPGADGNTPIGSAEKSIVQEFRSPISRITSISIQLGTYNQQNQGRVILTLDSVPYDESYHRESVVNARDVIDGAFQEFKLQPLNNMRDKLLIINLKFFPADTKSTMAVFYYNGHQSPPSLDLIKNLAGGTLVLNNSPSDGILSFSVNSDIFSPVFRSQNLVIYKNPNVFPRVFPVNKFHISDTYINAQNIIKDPNFDFRHEVVLEGNLPIEQANLLKLTGSNSDSSVNIISYSADKVEIYSNNSIDSLLVLTDVYSPGWHATVDGKDTHIYRADGLVRAIFVPVGKHTVEFSYMPQSFVLGLEISAFTIIILVGIWIYSKRKEQINRSIQSL